MKNFDDWLAEFGKKLQDSYRANKGDTKFAGIIRDISRPAGLLPLGAGRPISFADIDIGTQLEPYVLTGQEIKSYNIGLSYQIDEWAKAPELNDPDGTLMDITLEIMGRNIALREAYLVLKNLIEQSNVRLQSLERETIRRSDIAAAEKRMAEQGFTPDTVVLEPWQRYQLLVEEDADLGRFRDLMLSDKYTYAGKVANMDIYSTDLVKNTCLVYDKDYTGLVRTPFKIYFDNMETPKFLIVDRVCYAATIDPRSAITINIRPLDSEA
ncbi:MAG: hypothetical protein ACE5JV_00690 [Nitrososphaerales archaeon]